MPLGYATKEFCVIIKYQGYNKSVFTDTYPVYLPGSCEILLSKRYRARLIFKVIFRRL